MKVSVLRRPTTALITLEASHQTWAAVRSALDEVRRKNLLRSSPQGIRSIRQGPEMEGFLHAVSKGSAQATYFREGDEELEQARLALREAARVVSALKLTKAPTKAQKALLGELRASVAKLDSLDPPD